MAYRLTPEEKFKEQLLRDMLPDIGPVERRIRDHVKQLDITDPAKITYAEIAYSLARTLDRKETTSPAAVSKELREILGKLMERSNDLSDIFRDRMSP